MDKYELTPGNVRILGRTLRIAGFTWLGFSCSGIEFTTSAKHAALDIYGIPEQHDESQLAYLGIITDDDVAGMQKIRVRRGTFTYEILRNEKGLPRKVTILKLSESRNDKVGLGRIHADERISPTKAPDRKLLFIGDSICCGYGIDGSDFDGAVLHTPEEYQFTTADENPTRAYPYLISRALQADFHVIASSGNGIISQYIGPETDLPVTQDLIPALFSYTDRQSEGIVRIKIGARGIKEADGSSVLQKESTRWDQKAFLPDAIILNLGTNDASFTRQIPVRERHFAQNYAHFIETLQNYFPSSKILVTYGMMDTTLMDAARDAALMQNVDFLPLPQMNPGEDGTAAGGHPSRKTNRKMAELIGERLRVLLGETEETPQPARQEADFSESDQEGKPEAEHMIQLHSM